MSQRKWKIHIKCDSEPELKEVLREYAYILTGLRETEKKLKNGHRGNLFNELEEWKQKADDLINNHKVFYNEEN